MIHVYPISFVQAGEPALLFLSNSSSLWFDNVSDLVHKELQRVWWSTTCIFYYFMALLNLMTLDFWDLEYKKVNHTVPESIAARKAVEPFKKNGVKTVLDAGCGIGQDAEYLAKNGFIVHGIDYSKSAVEKASEIAHRNLTFECKSILDAPISEKKFDAVFCNKVVQLLLKSEREEAVKNIYGCLKNGGVAMISVVSSEDKGFMVGEKVEDGTIRKEDGRTVHYFGEEEFAELLSRHGLRDIKIEKFEEFGPITKLTQRKFRFLLASATKR